MEAEAKPLIISRYFSAVARKSRSTMIREISTSGFSLPSETRSFERASGVYATARVGRTTRLI